MAQDRADAVIIGGGIIGCCTAYYLAKKGVRAAVAEAGDIASGASGSCDRAIMIQSKNPGLMLRMALAGAQVYRELTSEFGPEIEYGRSGGMILIENDAELEVMTKMVRRQQESGLNVKILDRAEAIKMQPMVSAHILGSTLWDGDSDVNPMKVCLCAARAARSLGARFHLQTRVTGFLTEGGSLAGVITGNGEIRADKVLIAAGSWTPSLCRMLGFEIPIAPRKGHILVTEPLPALIRGNVLSGSYIARKHNPELAGRDPDPCARFGVGLSLGQTRSGNLLIGGSREFAGYDRSCSPEVIRAIAGNAARLFPALKNVRVIRTFAGLRPYTPDGLPVLGPVPGKPGLFIAAGHEGDGIALGPLTGKIMADEITGGNHGWDLNPFSPGRFRGSRR